MTLGDIKYQLVYLSGIPKILNEIMKRRLLVLAYHGIYDGPQKTGLYPATFIHVEDLANQLRFIKKKYRIISPADLQAASEQREELPPHAALITFDDGYESFNRLAFPVLKALDIKPIIFIATDYIEKQKPFWFDMAWFAIVNADAKLLKRLCEAVQLESNGAEKYELADTYLLKLKKLNLAEREKIISEFSDVVAAEIKNSSIFERSFYPLNIDQIYELARHGIVFGGHTHTHTILTSLPSDQVEEELALNKEKITGILGTPPVFFAYPNGGERDFNYTHKEILKRLGYICAFSLTGERSSHLMDPMNISRFHIAPENSLVSIKIRCSNLHSIWKSIH